MIGMVDLSSKGSKIHGIVEEYVAKGNISTGGFVKYLEEINAGNNIPLSNTNYSSYTIQAVALSENKVFITHTYNDYNHLYGMICTINGDTIEINSDTELSALSCCGQYVSAIKLAENKIFIAYRANTYKDLYGMICTINGDTVTINTNMKLYTNSSGSKTTSNVSTVLISESKVFITFMADSNDYYLYGLVCTISGDTITTGTATKLISSQATLISNLSVSQNKVFILYLDGTTTSSYSKSVVCTISGTTITVGTSVQIAFGTSSAELLDENKVFICYQHSVTNNTTDLSVAICTISGTTITLGEGTKLLYVANKTCSETPIMKISKNEVLITYFLYDRYGSGARELGSTICIINENVISVKTYEKLKTFYTTISHLTTILMLQSKILILYSYTNDYYLHAIINNLGKYIQTATQADKIYRHSPKQSYGRTSRQGHKTKLYRGGKLK